MALIEFKNKPNTDTPINDKNLNHNFKELNKKAQRTVMTAIMQNDYQTIEKSANKYDLPINKICYQCGDTSKLSISENGDGIKIGAGVSYVLVSAQIYWYTNVVSSSIEKAECIMYIRKNSSTEIAVNNSGLRDNYEHTQLSPFLVKVMEGDVINLSICTQDSTPLIKKYNTGTYLSVEVIE